MEFLFHLEILAVDLLVDYYLFHLQGMHKNLIHHLNHRHHHIYMDLLDLLHHYHHLLMLLLKI
jgi:hypothetical protein